MSVHILLLIGVLIVSGLLLTIKRGITITGDVPNAQAGKFVNGSLIAKGAKYSLKWTLIGTLPPGLRMFEAAASGGGFSSLVSIGGVPTTPGDYVFAVSVTDGAGQKATRDFAVKITAADALQVTDGVNTFTDVIDEGGQLGTPGTVGEVYECTITPIGGVPPYVVTTGAGALPAGLSFSTVTRKITGTPSAPAVTDALAITVTDAGVASLPVQLKPYCFNLAVQTPDGWGSALVRGQFASFQFEAFPGSAPYTWSIISGTLPTGLTLSSSGLLSGYSEVTTVGTNFTVQAVSAGGASDTRAFSIVISAATITAIANLPDGQIGETYYGTLTPQGGYGGYSSASVTNGALPTGLTLTAGTDADGRQAWLIQGTPHDDVQNIGTTSFTVTLWDAYGNSSGVACAITLAALDLVYVDTDIPSTGKVGVFYHGSFSIDGGLIPYAAFTVVAGALPPGITVHADSPSQGRFFLGHVPTTAGVYSFTLRATDAQTTPDTVDHTFAIKVDA